jgi:hypothetical protein
MFSLINPWVLVGILGLVISSYFYGHHAAYNEQAIEVARLNAIERDKEAEMVKIADNHATELRKANKNAKAQITKLQSDVASGAIRLSIATRTIQTSSDSPSTTGNTESRAELDPEAANALITIASDGDKAIRSLNACIDIYNEVRSKQ